MDLEAKALSDTGKEREINEDRAWAQVFESSESGPMGLFVVCDGMGGHLGGEVASHWAVEAIKTEMADLFCQRDPRATVHLSEAEMKAIEEGGDLTRITPLSRAESMMRNAIQRANQVILDYARKRPEKAADAGSTVTMAVVMGRRALIANVGDSRTYLLREHKLRQISQDHSLVASMVSSGQLKPKDIFSHPQRNVIYRSLGQKSHPVVDVFSEVLEPGDYLLLCSDGLWEMLHDENQIVRLIESASSLESACKKLIDAANKAGGEDNISVVLASVT